MWSPGTTAVRAARWRVAIIPHKLKLDGYGWGIMVRKWWQNRGRIDLDAIANFIGLYMAVEREC